MRYQEREVGGGMRVKEVTIQLNDVYEDLLI